MRKTSTVDHVRALPLRCQTRMSAGVYLRPPGGRSGGLWRKSAIVGHPWKPLDTPHSNS